MSLLANLQGKLNARFRSRLTGAGLSILCGLILWYFPIGEPLVHLSYDLPFLFAPKVNCDDLIIIKMDEQSYQETKQEWHLGEWNRALHAELLQKLKRDQSGILVFDVWFANTNKQEADDALAQAIKSHGAVVLPATLAAMSLPGVLGLQTLKPAPHFIEAATNWGISQLVPDTDLVVRQHYEGSELYPSLAWAAATVAKPSLAEKPADRLSQRWIRYYGPNGTLPSLSYHMALQKPAGYFEKKFVFIGGKPDTRYPGESVDDYRTPYTSWNGQKTPGVEINATMFLNLIRGDWLSRLSGAKECLLFVLGGLVVSLALAQVRPMVATGAAILASLLIALAGIVLVWTTHVWFSWMVLAGAQVPCALAWSILTYTKVLSHEKEVLSHEKEVLQIQLKTSAQRANTPPVLLTRGGPRGVPSIHDHTLVRRIGKGAYGEVWLAANAIGLYHAVKIVNQNDFNSPEPYLREFRGMQKYMPISLNHAGLLRILHVGRNDAEGYFYYVMELGDDQVDGSKINPESYSAKNLAKDLEKRGRLPVSECVSLGLTLTDALEFLHQQQLVHRDIKPSNIIFVQGVPKLADMGLVTDIGLEGKTVTYVGTEGYIAPEGPGSPAADVYSLGKVLYQAATGLPVRRFPALPASVVEETSTADLMRLNSIIINACENDPQKRYKSAAELRGWLFDLQRVILAN
jgi:CHASE2 domain-containing sensor protein